jgi:hypothetical protein
MYKRVAFAFVFIGLGCLASEARPLHIDHARECNLTMPCDFPQVVATLIFNNRPCNGQRARAVHSLAPILQEVKSSEADRLAVLDRFAVVAQPCEYLVASFQN